MEWVNARFTKPWRAEQAVAYLDDLAEFDTTDVWSALYHLYSQGIEFAPTGSKLKARALTERRQSALEDRYDNPALPVPVRESGWLVNDDGERETGLEHIRRVHAAKGPCGNPRCDIHKEATV